MRRTVENIRRGGVERSADPKPVSHYVNVLLWIPFAVRILTGAAGILSLLLTYGKLTQTSLIHEWSQVILPCTIISGVILVCTSAAVVLWFVGTLRAVSLQRRERRTDERGADTLIRLAKVTIGTNTSALLVFLFLWLLGVRLQHGPSISLMYPFTPLIILGCGHLLLAIFLVEPEIDSVRSFGFGLSLLAHSIVIVSILDSEDFSGRYWAYVFMPSWATYIWVIVLCIIRRKGIIRDISELEADLQLTRFEAWKSKAKIRCLRHFLRSVLGMGLWALFFCAAQVLLLWRLTFHETMVRWSVILTPAILGWIAFIGLAVESTTSCAYECLKEILSLAGMQVPTETVASQTETTPLLGDHHP